MGIEDLGARIARGLRRGHPVMVESVSGRTISYFSGDPKSLCYDGQRLSDYAERGHELGPRVWDLFGHDIFSWPVRHRDALFGLPGSAGHPHA